MTTLRILVLALVAGFSLAPPASADGRPVAILVNGFGDCCADRMSQVIDGLKAMGAEFPAVERRGLDGSQYAHYVVPWNSFTALDQGFQVSLDPMKSVQEAMGSSSGGGLMGALSNPAQALSGATLDQGVMDRVMGMVRRGSDEAFVDEVSAYVNSLPADRPVYLIGHSFGGDSLMEAVEKISRPVEFLGVLDPVGSGGQRRLERGRKVPANVVYFYNRWQNNGLFPFDYVSNGEYSECKAKTCDQGKQKIAAAGGELDHVRFPADPGLQAEILKALQGGSSSGSSSSGNGLKDQLKGFLGH